MDLLNKKNNKNIEKLIIIIHIFFISIFFFKSLTSPFNNWVYLSFCLYLTMVLVSLAYDIKDKLILGLNKSIQIILLSTIFSFFIGFILYLCF